MAEEDERMRLCRREARWICLLRLAARLVEVGKWQAMITEYSGREGEDSDDDEDEDDRDEKEDGQD